MKRGRDVIINKTKKWNVTADIMIIYGMRFLQSNGV